MLSVHPKRTSCTRSRPHSESSQRRLSKRFVDLENGTRDRLKFSYTALLGQWKSTAQRQAALHEVILTAIRNVQSRDPTSKAFSASDGRAGMDSSSGPQALAAPQDERFQNIEFCRRYASQNPDNADQRIFGGHSLQAVFDETGQRRKVINIQGDGNCAPRAIAHLIHNDENQWPLVKKQVKEFFDSHSEEIVQGCVNQGFIFGIDKETFRGKVEDQLLREGAHHDATVLAVYATALKVQIDVISVLDGTRLSSYKPVTSSRRSSITRVLTLAIRPENFFPVLNQHFQLQVVEGKVLTTLAGHYWAVESLGGGSRSTTRSVSGPKNGVWGAGRL